MKPAEKKLFTALKHEVINLHSYWLVYRQLFDGTKKRVELLNSTGSHVFYVLQNLLIDEMTLSISRLTDPATSNVRGVKTANLSLKRLVDKVDGRSHRELKHKLNELVKSLGDYVKPFRERRNKAVAHHDLATAMKLRTSIPGITKTQINNAIKAIGSLLNQYEVYHFDSTTAYDMTYLPLGSDGDYLVEILKRGQWFRDIEKRNIPLRELLKVSEYHNA